jgi:hypothetical protein
MWPVFTLHFNFGFLINHAGADVALITLYIYQLWTILSVLRFIWKLQFKTLGNNFDHVNVANIHLAIQFRVFDQSCRRKGTTNYLIPSLPIGCSWGSWMGWKAIHYPFYGELRSCKCGQYWLSNSISTFWSMIQVEEYS